ncbi:DUF4388 domain-containing protein [Fontisphaera persica]|uniref:DUF4388 domain-containing protein n=1 Tax=Fontisphaera persica TaxID=2974023 RepID=UPI0024C066BE|nr:DUF4388 domain-containing protein [Fontisphaera persica]WCJ60085.1 DUF4388 domain-containing protein [Fontisphaera persica]
MKTSRHVGGGKSEQASRRTSRPGETGRLSLLWLSGPCTGEEVVLPIDRPTICGRSREADLRIEDDLVSRRHTKIVHKEGQYLVEDLGSKNGTFLNGEKLTGPAALKPGDYLRIGEATFHVVVPCVVGEQARSWWEQTQRTMVTMAHPSPQQAAAAPKISGSLTEVPLMDLLQLLSNSMKTGCVTLRQDAQRADIWLRQGQIYYASLNQQPAPRPEKTLMRILRWSAGTFTFTPGTEQTAPVEITEPTGSVLLEGARQADEISAFDELLPPLTARLQLAFPLPHPLRQCTPEELDVLQLVLEHGVLEKVLDAFPGSDLDALQILVPMLQKKLITHAVDSPPPQ